ncbi:MAG: transposase [Verrucomicrobia bacterium]|nr:transposase [Verrucomicrobiota bacterium]
MYEYRKLSVAERKAVLSDRRQRDLPLHAPPHYPDGRQIYILTAACFEHRPFVSTEPRRSALRDTLLAAPGDIHAWVILPNHYHLLATVDLAGFSQWVRLLHSRLAKDWNREDAAKGRQVWYRFQDRQIRGDRHYFASLNYIHANPVKHGYVAKATDWLHSSLHEYLAKYGREVLADLWRKYPVDEYGKKWDD